MLTECGSCTQLNYILFTGTSEQYNKCRTTHVKLYKASALIDKLLPVCVCVCVCVCVECVCVWGGGGGGGKHLSAV